MNLYFEEYPGYSEIDLLFVHGNLASTIWWKPMLEAWPSDAKGSGSLIFVDWRGCGKNPDWDQKPFELRDLAADVLQLVESRSQRPMGVIGHSLGGLITLQMLQMAPQRFEKALLLDSVGARGVIFDAAMEEAFVQMAKSRELTQTVILSTILNAEKLSAEFKEQITDDAYKAVRGIGKAALEVLKFIDLREELKKIHVPTLILHGKHDAIIPPKDGEKLAQLLPNAEFQLLEAAGHCWNVEHPQAFASYVRDWFSATPKN